MHFKTTKERPVDRFTRERELLRPLPAYAFDTDEVVSAIVSFHARIHFDGNRYSVPPQWAGKTVLLRANETQLRVIGHDEPVACHDCSYDRGQLIRLPEHELEALKMRSRVRAGDLEKAFDAPRQHRRRTSSAGGPIGRLRNPTTSHNGYSNFRSTTSAGKRGSAFFNAPAWNPLRAQRCSARIQRTESARIKHTVLRCAVFSFMWV